MLKEKVATFTTSKISTIEILPEEVVYGLTVDEDESHVTGGIVTHNTGRPRQVNWMDIDRLRKACEMNGVDALVVSKVDVLRQVNVWNTIMGGEVQQHGDEDKFKAFVEGQLKQQCVIWSDSPERI
jgi:adenylosuccinate synthase